MPPKSPLPDLIFVSDELSGALLHHSNIDDFVELLVEHIKSKILTISDEREREEDEEKDLKIKVEDYIFQFAVFSIDCEPSLKFIKKEHVYGPIQLMRFVIQFIESHSYIGLSNIPFPKLAKHSETIFIDLKKELKTHVEKVLQ